MENQRFGQRSASLSEVGNLGGTEELLIDTHHALDASEIQSQLNLAPAPIQVYDKKDEPLVELELTEPIETQSNSTPVVIRKPVIVDSNSMAGKVRTWSAKMRSRSVSPISKEPPLDALSVRDRSTENAIKRGSTATYLSPNSSGSSLLLNEPVPSERKSISPTVLKTSNSRILPSVSVSVHEKPSPLSSVAVDSIQSSSFADFSVFQQQENESTDTETEFLTKIPVSNWTNASIFSSIPDEVDLISKLMNQQFAIHSEVPTNYKPRRNLPTINDAIQSIQAPITPEKVLSHLIKCNSWRSIASLCAKQLINIGQSKITMKELSKLWNWWIMRLHSLYKLRHFDILEYEVDILSRDFGLKLEDFCESVTGDVVDWNLKCFWAHVPGFRESYIESVSRFYSLINQCRNNINKNTDLGDNIWVKRIKNLQFLISNTLVQMKDYRLSISILKGLIAGDSELDLDYITYLARVNLQLGDVAQAKKFFNWVEVLLVNDSPEYSQIKQFASQFWNTNPADAESKAEVIKALPLSSFQRLDLLLINRAFVSIAWDNDWEEASKHLTQLLSHQDTINLSNSPEHLTSIVNDIAVCHLYSGNVRQALLYLEGLVAEKPSSSGSNPPFLFNLSTLYDLVDQSTERKKRLLSNVVSIYGGDDLDPACLKL